MLAGIKMAILLIGDHVILCIFRFRIVWFVQETGGWN